MRSRCVLRINREGKFTVCDESESLSQCGKIGEREYRYFVTIQATNRQLTAEGYVMENTLVDKYFQEKYNDKKMKCDSCEAMAQRAIDDLRRLVRAQNPKIELTRIYVRLHGSEASFIEAEWWAP